MIPMRWPGPVYSQRWPPLQRFCAAERIVEGEARLKEYPPGVPHEIDPGQFRSLKELIEDALERSADREAYLQMGRTLTFREVDRMSLAFAVWLQRQGLKKGDRIALMLPNVLQYPIVMFGALRAGIVVVNTNPLYTADELRYQLQDSGAVAIVVLENFCHVVQAVKAETQLRHIVVTAVGDLLGFPKGVLVNFVLRHVQRKGAGLEDSRAHSLAKVLLRFDGQSPEDTDIEPNDIAFLQYTGGTTGVSKGAMLSHRNMVSNTLQARAWFEQVNLEHATYYIALPLYHIFSLTGNCLLHLLTGGFGVMIPNPRDFPAFVKDCRSIPRRSQGGEHPRQSLMSTPDSRRSISASWPPRRRRMAVQAVVAERWKKLTGCPLSQGWGLTETSPVATVNLLRNTDFNGSVGLPLPSTEITARDDAGQDVGFGKTGEICVRGPQVMLGYWKKPEETAQVMLPDGWLRTGDIGRIDERGYVFLEDRKKDMITVSGFKVYPNEVEAVAAQHPGIFEAAALPSPTGK